MSRYSPITAAELKAAVGSYLVYLANQDDVRQISQSEFLSYLQSLFTSEQLQKTIYTPANGFNIVVADDTYASTDWRWVVLRPSVTLATGTLVLPAPAEAADGQELLFTTKEEITALTVNGNGASEVNGAPTTLAAGANFRLKYESQSQSWNLI
jgi:hypothetical protein